ncbi:MAG: hypothetical protein F4X99_09450 [Gammaproteobacteria bacterium]|nr:hypothetical protein [Gammaproteobacteria bacterium]
MVVYPHGPNTGDVVTLLFSDRGRLGDLLILLAFVAVLIAPLPSLPRLATYLLAALVLCSPALWRATTDSRLAACTAALLAYLVLTSLWSGEPNTSDALRMCVRALVLCCFVLAFADSVARGAAHERIGRWFAVAGGLVAVAAIGNFLLDPPPEGRLHGLGRVHNSVTAAQAFAVVALVALDSAWRAPAPRWRLLAGACAVAAILAVLLSGSRAAWAALPLGVAALWLASTTPSRARFTAYLGASAAAMALVAAVLATSDLTRDYVLPRGDSFRFAIWESVVADIVRQGLWFGRGILTPDDTLVGELTFRHVHSMYLAVLFHGGIVGCVLFAAALGGTAFTLVRALGSPDARLALALLAAGAVFWLTDGRQLLDRVGVHWWFFWLPVATAIGIGAGSGRDAAPRG